jgi:hypothetical protein
VLGIENGCELRVFESTPGKPTMQVQNLGVFLLSMCVCIQKCAIFFVGLRHGYCRP